MGPMLVGLGIAAFTTHMFIFYEAFAAQDSLIESFGGIQAALKIGGKSSRTRPPKG